MLNEFHFLRPEWLLLAPIAVVFCYLLWKKAPTLSGWQPWLAPHLQTVLLSAHQQNSTAKYSFVVLLASLLLAIVAAAGPSWQKIPQPAMQLKKATVLVMDMSLSMLATDTTPNRVTQARFKALDFATQLGEGELALVSFAGDAFVISPLTPDHNNIRLLLPELKPEIMPVQGSNLWSALQLADQLLQQAGYPKGDIVVMTDGFSTQHFQQLRSELNQWPHRVSVLAFGSEDGAPIQLPNGELLKDQRGQIILPRVAFTQLEQIADITGGLFRRASFDQSDITSLLAIKPFELQQDHVETEAMMGDQWHDAGIYFVWFLLPLALWLGKRTSIFVLCLAMSIPTPSQAEALSWQDVWQSQQQQAKEAYEQQDFAKARAKFADPLWQGNAAYRAGDFAAAAELYQQVPTAEGHFNLGNSLAQQQNYAQALQAFLTAKSLQPDFLAAEQNAKLMEQLLAEQNQQDQQSSSDPNQGQRDQQASEQQDGDGSENRADTESTDNSSSAQDQNSATDPESSMAGNEADTAEQAAEQNAQQQAAQQQAEQDSADLAESEQANTDTEQQAMEKAIAQAWPNASADERQKLDVLLRKVQDDPSLLLRQKMLLEYQKRHQQRLPQGEEQQW